MKNVKLLKQLLSLLKSGFQPTFAPKAIDLFDGLIVKLSKTYDAGQLPKKFENEAGLGNLYPLGANAVFLAVYAKLNKKIPFKEKNKALHEFIGFEEKLDFDFIGKNALKLHEDILDVILNFWENDLPKLTINAMKKYVVTPGF